jgi:hypothetical protein
LKKNRADILSVYNQSSEEKHKQLAGTTTTTCFLQQQQPTLKVLADHELH